MSTCRVRIIAGVVTLFFVLPFITVSAASVDTEKMISPFTVEGVLGNVESTQLFIGRRVVFAVVGASCSGARPFLVWRKRLSPDKVDRALIFCVGGHQKDASVTISEDAPIIWFAPNQAMKALGITGVPMLLGIEDNRVKWRIAGLIPQWQVLVNQWIMNNE